MTQLANTVANVVVERLKAWNPQAVAQVIEYRAETTIVVPRDLLRATAEQCRDNPDLKFNLLSDATCVDRFPIEPRFELNYQLVSMERRDRVRLRTSVSAEEPVVDSLVPVWGERTGSNARFSIYLEFALRGTQICVAFCCRTSSKDLPCGVISRSKASVRFRGGGRKP